MKSSLRHQKEAKELEFWSKKVEQEGGKLRNSWYKRVYCENFKIPELFYSGKRIVDIGCGPRGSLEWATSAQERVGVDPLTGIYCQLGSSMHEMKYVEGSVQSLPFHDCSFDVVSAFNVLEYISNLSDGITEIARILKPRGLFLLASQDSIKNNFLRKLKSILPHDLVAIDESRYELCSKGFYSSLGQNNELDYSNELDRPTVFSMLFYKATEPFLEQANPRVSVIIPTFNNAAYIGNSLESILNQTYKRFEVIVVDDGSTDSTQLLLRPYSNLIQYIYQENRGSSAARNLGISKSKGELIAFLDADDAWVSCEKLDKEVSYFDKDSKLGFIQSGWRLINEIDEHEFNVRPWENSPQLDLYTWLHYKPVRLNSLMARRSCLEHIGCFDEELLQCQDIDLVLRMALQNIKSAWLKEITSSYRIHSRNTTGNSSDQCLYLELTLDKFFHRDDLPSHIRNEEAHVRYSTIVWLAWYQYYKGNLSGMASFLRKSLQHTSLLKDKAIADWIENFIGFSREVGFILDVDSLTDTSEWENLIFQLCLSTSST